MVKMTQNRLVFPLTTEGMPWEAAKEIQDALKQEFCFYWGGYTETFGRGGWVARNGATITEEVAVYDIAFVPTEQDRRILRKLAEVFGRHLKQVSVYLVIDGEAIFVDVPERKLPAPKYEEVVA